MQIAYLSDTGTNKANNQDSVGIFTNHLGFQLAIVADGVTSNLGGDVASEMVVHNIGRKWSEEQISDLQSARLWLDKIAKEENDRILEAGKQFSNLSSMATTFVSAINIGTTVLIANLGDSRAYQLSVDKKELTQLTFDHFLSNELIREGVIDKEDAKNVPKGSSVTRYFGTKGKVELEFFEVEIKNDDIILLATDGLSKEVEDKDIREILLNQEISLGEMTAKLIDLANKQSGFDNVTVLLMSQFMEEKI